MSQIGTSFRKISLFDATCFDIDPWADSDDELPSFILPKTQESKLNICTWHVHGFPAPKLDGHLPKVGRVSCKPEKIARKNASALPQS